MSAMIAGGDGSVSVLSQSFSLAQGSRVKLLLAIASLLAFDVVATLAWVAHSAWIVLGITPRPPPEAPSSAECAVPSSAIDHNAGRAASTSGSRKATNASTGMSSTPSWLQYPAVVIDTGSSACRFGFGTPVAKSKGSIASVCGFPRRVRSGSALQPVLGGADPLGIGELLSGKSSRKRGVLIGESAIQSISFANDLDMVYPVKEGRVCDWDAMEAMWAHVFERELCVDPSKQPVLISWSPGESKENAERAVELLFEKFNVPAVYLGVSPVLALYSSGINSGCVLESGDGATHACCVIEGFAYPAATVRSAVSGRSATVYLQELLRLRGHHFAATQDFLRIRDIKESICYCATEYDGEVKLAMQRNRVSAVLPDGTVTYQLTLASSSPSR